LLWLLPAARRLQFLARQQQQQQRQAALRLALLPPATLGLLLLLPARRLHCQWVDLQQPALHLPPLRPPPLGPPWRVLNLHNVLGEKNNNNAAQQVDRYGTIMSV
jgi:hypothetical protein